MNRSLFLRSLMILGALLVGLGAYQIGHAGRAAAPDFRWEGGPDRLVFKIRLAHVPTVRVTDEHLDKRYYYLDFYRENGPEEQQDYNPQSSLIMKVTRVYYPDQKVLRYVFYTPFRADIRFESTTLADNTHVITVTRIAPETMAHGHGVAGAAPAYTAPTPSTAPPSSTPGVLKKMVVIDPGHGGIPPDPSIGHGAQTSRRINGRHYEEKELTLAIANYLAEYIRRTDNLDCYMTRTDDVYVSLDRRIELANQAQGDLFLSIHLNATSSRRKTARGFEIYYISSEEKAVNRELAQLENDVRVGGSNLSDQEELVRQQILRSLADEKFPQIQAQGRNLCMVIDQEFLRAGPMRAYDRGVKSEAFRVLLNFNMPSALAECGFLDNPQDAAIMVTPAYQKKIAALFFNGINRYFAMVDPAFKPLQIPVEP